MLRETHLITFFALVATTATLPLNLRTFYPGARIVEPSSFTPRPPLALQAYESNNPQWRWTGTGRGQPGDWIWGTSGWTFDNGWNPTSWRWGWYNNDGNNNYWNNYWRSLTQGK